MTAVASLATEHTTAFLVGCFLTVYFLWTLQTAVANVYFHPLSTFPGPRLAATSVVYKACVEGVLRISWHSHLAQLHVQYGPTVRVGPNELHFSNPRAYNDIYNNANRWDKEETLYRSFGEDRSSFGFLTYKEAKERKDVLNRSFSSRAIVEARGIVQSKIDELGAVFSKLSQTGERVNLSFAFRCMTIDIITTYCFGTSVAALEAPGFRAPIILAMDASQPVFVWFKHLDFYKVMVTKCPRPISRVISPPTAGLVDLQEILESQIKRVTSRPETLDELPHRQTIYHSLLDRSAYKSQSAVPSAGSLYEEAQALMFAGADTVGNTLMVMAFHLFQPANRPMLRRLQSELRQVGMEDYDGRSSVALSQLESLPYLNAVIKESLRLFSGVISGLPRIVPSTGATIAGTAVPPGTIVSMGSTFVHYNADIFPDPHTFNPDRWLLGLSSSPPVSDGLTGSSSRPDPDAYFVPFSRGPRSCLGVNLAWLELRLATATVYSRFEMDLEEEHTPKTLTFRDAFLPEFTSGEVLVRLRERTRRD